MLSDTHRCRHFLSSREPSVWLTGTRESTKEPQTMPVFSFHRHHRRLQCPNWTLKVYRNKCRRRTLLFDHIQDTSAPADGRHTAPDYYGAGSGLLLGLYEGIDEATILSHVPVSPSSTTGESARTTRLNRINGDSPSYARRRRIPGHQ